MQSIYAFLNTNNFVYVYLSALIIIGFLLIDCYRLRIALRAAIDLLETERNDHLKNVSLYKIQMRRDNMGWIDLPVLRTNLEVTEEAISSLRDSDSTPQLRIVEVLATLVEGSEKVIEE